VAGSGSAAVCTDADSTLIAPGELVRAEQIGVVAAPSLVAGFWDCGSGGVGVLIGTAVGWKPAETKLARDGSAAGGGGATEITPEQFDSALFPFAG